MTEKTQILDVTYGTFSCRLEGFDDSVETMKLVVGYFHELAGHDRFMDMSPQAPDMDTLAQLTGENSDVDAALEDSKLSLRLRNTSDTSDERPPLRLTPAPIVTAAPEHQEPDDLDADDGDADQQGVDHHDLEATTAEADSSDDESGDDELHTESVAAKLERIRAVVGRGHVSETSDTYAEDNTDDDLIAPRGGVNPLAQRLAELAKRNSELAAIEAGINPAVLDLSGDRAEGNLDEDWDDDDLALADSADDDLEDLEDLIALDATDTDDLDTNSAPDEPSAEETPAAQDKANDGPFVLTNPETDLGDDDLDDEDLHLANLVEDDDLNLHEEVAEVERQIEDRNKRHELSRTADAAISRIMLQTDEKLNQPELRRQQDAFAQLKAAVVATEAARQLGDDGSPKRRPSEVYRRDLGEFEAEEAFDDSFDVKENNEDPELDALDTAAANDAGETPVTEEPEAQRPATTLRLVASQRTADPVRPVDAASLRLRQIAANVDTSSTRPIAFPDFADEHGVSDLEEMIEAAAAYIAFVIKEADFSRPQVMKLVQTAGTEEISREDGLRSFGRLLRQNRIIKLDNGRFKVAPNTRFRPDDKEALG